MATVRAGGDCVAYSDTKDPEKGFRLNFFTYKKGKHKGHYVRIRPNGISMRGFEVPVCGISLDNKIYVMCKTEHVRDRDTFRKLRQGFHEEMAKRKAEIRASGKKFSEGEEEIEAFRKKYLEKESNLFTDRSVLTSFDPRSGTFRFIRDISRLPEGKFIEISAHVDPNPMPGLPSKEHNILLWGSGKHRRSNCYLAVIPQSQFETGKQMKYFTGLDENGNPNWSSSEKDAKPVVEHPTIGDISVTWCSDLKLWIMTYDSRRPDRGIVFRYSATPWGPWSEKQVIFDARRDKGFGYFIHDVHSKKDDGLAGPVVGIGKDNPKKVGGGHYAPYVVERFTKFNNGILTIYYVLSTWNPYVVVLMKSQFKVEINNEKGVKPLQINN